MQHTNTNDYKSFYSEILEAIQSARIETAKLIYKSHISHYFNVGNIIVKRQEQHGWGKSIVEKLSSDLRKNIDGIEGYSATNLWNMRKFYIEYQNEPELLALAMQVPWMQNIKIIEKIKETEARRYYLYATAQMGWSRAVLINQIKANAYEYYLQNPKQNNFDLTLPEHLAEQADEALKSSYNLDFLGISNPVRERRMENMLIEKIRDFIMELGYGFCFIGNQYTLKFREKEYNPDLLFYHRILKCLVVIELKTVDFEPEFAGKMNFYLDLVDAQLKQEDDNPTIGIILCPEKDNFEVEFILKSYQKPIGVAEYRLTKELPDNLKGKLPTANELKTKLIDEIKKK